MVGMGRERKLAAVRKRRFLANPVVLLCSDACIIVALPCGFMVVSAPSFSAALLSVSRPGNGQASCCTTLGLVLPMLVLHGVRRIVILIALCATDHRARRRTLGGAREAVTIGA